STFFIRCLRRLRDHGWPFPDDDAAAPPPPGAPSSAQVLPHFVRYGARIGRKVAHWSMFDIYHWMVAVAPREPGRPAIDSLATADFHMIDQPPDSFYADPVLFDHQGDTYLFIEIFPYARNSGVLAVARLDAR